MLILVRRPGESIMIGKDIEVKVLGYNEATACVSEFPRHRT